MPKITITKKKRKEIEDKIYTTFDKLDKTGKNSRHYAEIFATMSDEQFVKFLSGKHPFRFYSSTDVKPSMSDIKNACSYLGVPLMERVNLRYLYENKKGEAPWSKEAYVIYLPIKRMVQMNIKKLKHGYEIGKRDLRSGLLIADDKGSQTSFREMEALAAFGLTNTMDEMSKFRADAMDAKNVAYNIINTTGVLHKDDIPDEKGDSLSKNYINAYFLGSHLNTNIVNTGNYTQHTLDNKGKKITREVE